MMYEPLLFKMRNECRVLVENWSFVCRCGPTGYDRKGVIHAFAALLTGREMRGVCVRASVCIACVM